MHNTLTLCDQHFSLPPSLSTPAQPMKCFAFTYKQWVKVQQRTDVYIVWVVERCKLGECYALAAVRGVEGGEVGDMDEATPACMPLWEDMVPADTPPCPMMPYPPPRDNVLKMTIAIAAATDHANATNTFLWQCKTDPLLHTFSAHYFWKRHCLQHGTNDTEATALLLSHLTKYAVVTAPPWTHSTTPTKHMYTPVPQEVLLWIQQSRGGDTTRYLMDWGKEHGTRALLMAFSQILCTREWGVCCLRTVLGCCVRVAVALQVNGGGAEMSLCGCLVVLCFTLGLQQGEMLLPLEQLKPAVPSVTYTFLTDIVEGSAATQSAALRSHTAHLRRLIGRPPPPSQQTPCSSLPTLGLPAASLLRVREAQSAAYTPVPLGGVVRGNESSHFLGMQVHNGRSVETALGRFYASVAEGGGDGEGAFDDVFERTRKRKGEELATRMAFVKVPVGDAVSTADASAKTEVWAERHVLRKVMLASEEDTVIPMTAQLPSGATFTPPVRSSTLL